LFEKYSSDDKCKTNDNTTYKIFFNGTVIQNGTLKTAWSTKQRKHYNESKEFLWSNCSFPNAIIDGKKVFPFIQLDGDGSIVDIRY